MSGTAAAADAAGNIFFLEGNGTFETTLNAQGFPSNADCGNCFVKISTGAGLKLVDYFTPHNTVAESSADLDLGSGGAILLPDVQDAGGVTKHPSVGAGKEAIIYIADRGNMGKFNAGPDQIYQEMSGQLRRPGILLPPHF